MTIERIVFVHGWSVHHTKTYGELPERLAAKIPGIEITHLYLGKYISFRDEVRMNDVARAMESAVTSELANVKQFAVVTHSTGGPVTRTWLQQYYLDKGRDCPMTHLVHLAAAHFGSALAVLGKGALGKVKSFINGIEPGQGVLDWLCLGSEEAWRLNKQWIQTPATSEGSSPVFQFCLVGQMIDRKFYDNLNPYTGEMGSDGTVRVAAANLNSSYIKLVQHEPTQAQLDQYAAHLEDDSLPFQPSHLRLAEGGFQTSQSTPFCVIPNTSHTGKKIGIMESVKRKGRIPPVVDRIIKCFAVDNEKSFAQLASDFDQITEIVLKEEKVEHEDRLLNDRHFIHDTHSMVIFRVRDEEGYVPDNFRILFTGPNNNPNKLPTGFLADRQANKSTPGMVTFYFNHDLMIGDSRVAFQEPGSKRAKTLRPAVEGIEQLGLMIEATPDDGFAHYYPCVLNASREMLQAAIRPNQTTMIDIVLKRVVHENTFSFSKDLKREEFRKTNPGNKL